MKAYIVKVFDSRAAYYTVTAGDEEEAKHKIMEKNEYSLLHKTDVTVLEEVNEMLNDTEDKEDQIYRFD